MIFWRLERGDSYRCVPANLVNLSKAEFKNNYARALCFRLFENNGIIKRDLVSKLLFKDKIMLETKLRKINKYNISLLIRKFVETSKFKDLKIYKVSFL